MSENKQYITLARENGSVMISEDVITTIVAHAAEEIEGVAAVENVLDDDELSAADILLNIVGDLNHTGGIGSVTVGRHGDKFHIAFDLARADDVRHKDERTAQHADEQGIAALKVLIHLRTHVIDALCDLLLGVQYFQNILIHHTHGVLSFISISIFVSK